MKPIDPLTAALAFLPVYFASIFAHELGHAVAGWLVGYVVTSFGLGTSRPLFVAAPRGVRVYFCRVRPSQGITFAFMPQIYPSRARMAWFAAGGIVANGLLAAVALGLLYGLPGGGSVWLTVAAVNGLLAAISLLPFRFRVGKATLRTDGALILQALRTGLVAQPPPDMIQTARYLRDLWLSVGDTLILRVYLIAAAQAWIELGDIERADDLCREADSLPGASPPDVRSLGGIVRSQIALGAGRPDEADAALDAAEAYYRAAGHRVGLFLIALCRASVRVGRGDPAGAARDLDALVTDPTAAGHPALALSLLTTRLSAAVAASDLDAVGRTRAEYEAVRVPRHSAARDLQVYRSLARFDDGRGERAGAAAAYRRAIGAVSQLAGLWVDAEDRARFLETQSRLFAEACDCLRALGMADEADRLAESLTGSAPETPARWDDLKCRRWGYRLMLANFTCAAGASGLAAVVDRASRIPFVLLAVLLSVALMAGAFYLVFDQTLGRLAPALRKGGGMAVLLLACLPWLVAALVLFLTLFDPDRHA